MPERERAALYPVALEQLAGRWLSLEERLAGRIHARDWPGAAAELAAIDDLASALPARVEPNVPVASATWSALRSLHDANVTALATWSTQVRDDLLRAARSREGVRVARTTRWINRTG